MSQPTPNSTDSNAHVAGSFKQNAVTSDTPPPRLSVRLLKGILWGLLSVVVLVASLLILLFALLLWHPKTANTLLPYLENLTEKQLQIESAEGKLVDGLRLNNLRFTTPTVELQIDQIELQWSLSALFQRHLHLQTLTVNKPTLRLISTETESPPPVTQPFNFFEPFALLMQLDTYNILLDLDHLNIQQASLQFDDQPAIEVAQLSGGLHWQARTLTLENFTADYQDYQLQVNSRFEAINAANFTTELELALSGLENLGELKGLEGLEDLEVLKGLETLKMNTRAHGNLQRVNLTVEMSEPYSLHSEHQLTWNDTLDDSSIQLASQFNQLKAKLSKQWQINQLQGTTHAHLNLADNSLESQGALMLHLEGKSPADLSYSAEYRPTGQSQFEFNTLFKGMGSLQMQGEANLQDLQKPTVTATLRAQELNLQWLDSTLNYQINTLLGFTLSDYQNKISQLEIQQLEVAGLPESFALKGKLTTRTKTIPDNTAGVNSPGPAPKHAPKNAPKYAPDYAINLQTDQLKYADYSGQLKAQLFVKPDLSEVALPAATLSLGNNRLEMTGLWAKTVRFSLNAHLNQLNQLYAPLSGKVTAKVDVDGRLLTDLSNIDQAWSNIQVTANNLRYQLPAKVNAEQDTLPSDTLKPSSREYLTLKQLNFSAKAPLHQLEWTTFALDVDEVLKIRQTFEGTAANTTKNQKADNQKIESQTLFTSIHARRQLANDNVKGLHSTLDAEHPDLSFHVELNEVKPGLNKSRFALSRFDINQPDTGNWRLTQTSDATEINWKSPFQFKTDPICLQSTTTPEAKLCLQADADHANWSLNQLPIFDWAKPWLGDSLVLKGHLSGEGSAQWKKQATLQQSLRIPQLDILVTQQGYTLPFVVKAWQTDLLISDNKATLKSQAGINEAGELDIELTALTKNEQAWSNASLDGHLHLNLEEWPLKGRILELVALNKTNLDIKTTLSGTPKNLQHDTQANIDLNLDLPLLGLKRQVIQLQASITPKVVDAKGLWIQNEHQVDQRQADLTLRLSGLDAQPKVLVQFDTQSIELLKTPFAHLSTSADIEVTLLDGKTQIMGQVELHDSELNLDDMPLHQRTSTSDDEIIIDEQGNIVPKEEAFSNLAYDLRIGFGDNVKVRVQDSQLLLGGELQLVQGFDSPDMKAFGEVKVREGYINLDARNQIKADASSFLFNGVIANPTLNVNLFRVVDQTTARLNITGTVSQPQFVFYSTPALSQGRIINLMVFGRTGDMSKEPNYESQILSAFYKLGIQNNTPVLNTLTSTLGIQDVYFDVQDQQVSSLLVGRSLSDKLYVRYARDLTGQQKNAVQFFYQLTNKWLLKTNNGDNNSSVDLIFRHER